MWGFLLIKMNSALITNSSSSMQNCRRKRILRASSGFRRCFIVPFPIPCFCGWHMVLRIFICRAPAAQPRGKGKEVWENSITKVRSFELVPAFKAALHPSFSHTANLRDLYIRWIRSLYGLMIHSLPWTELMGNPQPFFLPDTIEAGTRAWGSLSTLFEEWKSLNSRLNKERQPNHRVTLGNKRFDVREQILSLAASLPFRAFPE